MEPKMEESDDWRTQLQPEARQKIVNIIVEDSNRHLKTSVPEELIELNKFAVKVEEVSYAYANSQSDYRVRIARQMIARQMMKAETHFQSTSRPRDSVSLLSSAAGSSQNPQDPGNNVDIPKSKRKRHVRTESEPQTNSACFSSHHPTTTTEPVTLELVLSEVRTLQSSVGQLHLFMDVVLSEPHQIQRRLSKDEAEGERK